MSKLSSLKIPQLKKYLGQNVYLKGHTVYYLQPVSILVLAKFLHFDWKEQKNNFPFLDSNWDVNLTLSEENMQRVVLQLGYDCEKYLSLNFYEQVQDFGFSYLQKPKLLSRSLIVTIMGHVDHGKTTLLDVIRNSHLAAKEEGKITQKIGGYQINFQNEAITFIDTPGHQLFTSMRAQGVNVTDLVVLVVAGNEGIKEQTIEAINHAKSAQVLLMVFVNKMDLAVSNLERVIKQLATYDLLPPKQGGETFFVPGSCLTQKGISQLLGTILKVKQKVDLKVDFNSLPKAVVLDSYVDRQGVKAVVIIQKGTLRIKDAIIVDHVFGKVKVITNDLQQKLTEATPGMCVSVLGLNEVVTPGSLLFAFPDEKLVLNLAKESQSLVQENQRKTKLNKHLAYLKTFWDEVDTSQTINLIIKLDSKGSEKILESKINALKMKKKDELKLNFLHIGLGPVNLNDLNLAFASKSIILTFNLKLSNLIHNKIKNQEIELHNFDLFHHFFDYLDQLKIGQLELPKIEKIIGQAKVLKIFTHSRLGTIAGCIVQKGIIKLGDEKMRIIRHGQEIATNLSIKSLKHEKESIQLAVLNQEFGVVLVKFNDFQVDDQIIQFGLVSSDVK